MIFLLFNNTKSKANTWCLHIFPLKSLWATFSKGLKDLKGRCFRAALVSTNRAQQVSLGAAQGGSWAVFTAARMLSGKPPKAFSAYLQPRAASSAHNSGAHRHTATPPSQTARAQQSSQIGKQPGPTFQPAALKTFTPSNWPSRGCSDLCWHWSQGWGVIACTHPDKFLHQGSSLISRLSAAESVALTEQWS